MADAKYEKKPREVDNSEEEETESRKVYDDIEFNVDDSKLLIETETYLKSGIHIGTKFKSGEMKSYIFKKRKDGLMVFNIETIDQRIRMVAKILSNYEGKDIVITSRRLYGHKPIKKFAEMIGAKALTGRFIPGTFTNPEARSFIEPSILMVCDPMSDFQAVKEATAMKIPVIAIAGSESPLKDVDFIIPANNRGRKALALIFYLLSRETLIERKEISKEAFKAEISDFEQEIEEKKYEKAQKRFTTTKRFRR